MFMQSCKCMCSNTKVLIAMFALWIACHIIKHLLEKCGFKVFTAWFFTDRPFNSQKFSDLKEYAVKKRLNFHKIKSKRSMDNEIARTQKGDRESPEKQESDVGALDSHVNSDTIKRLAPNLSCSRHNKKGRKEGCKSGFYCQILM